MIAFLWALIGGVRGLIAAAIAAVAVGVSLSAYDRLIDDPAVAAAARKDLVARAELTAAEAELAEVRRQLDAGSKALEQYRILAEADAIADAEKDRRTEQEIAVMEAKLIEQGRRCPITEEDLLEFR